MADQKQWADMTKQERETFKAERKGQAISLIKEKKFPAGVTIKVGDNTMTLRPSGVSDKGSVAYSLPPTTLQYKGKHLRINKVSISVLTSEEQGEVVEGDIL